MKKIKIVNVKNIIYLFKSWLDVVFLIPGMAFLDFGVFKIYIPAGYISIGICLMALAFFIAKKQSTRR